MVPPTAPVTGESLSGTGPETHPHQGVHAQDQQQGRTIHQDTAGGLAYVIAYQISAERNCWPPRNMGIYHGNRATWLSVASALSSASSDC